MAKRSETFELGLVGATIALVFAFKTIFEIFFDPPVEINFDYANPAQSFWSRESPRDEKGNKKSGVFWEYRVEVKNNSSKTIRNVSVTTEHIGGLPIRPADQVFDKIGRTSSVAQN
jgi:hypothetical protein